MDDSIRVMVELGKKKRVVACAFDRPAWDRSAKTEDEALRALETQIEAWSSRDEQAVGHALQDDVGRGGR